MIKVLRGEFVFNNPAAPLNEEEQTALEYNREFTVKSSMGRKLEVPIETLSVEDPDRVMLMAEVFYMTGDQYREMIKVVHTQLTPEAKELLKPYLSLDKSFNNS